MKLILGLELDGCPLPPSVRGVNRLATGPTGLLDFLELRLGLPAVPSNPMSRLLAYRDALARADGEKTGFYSASFALDPLGTAKVLLGWRDQLRLSGWAGEFSGDAVPERLASLGEVEKRFREITGGRPDEAMRLERIARSLEKGDDPGVAGIELIESLGHFPQAWREVLERLPVREQAFPLPPEPLARPGTLLHHLQARLLEKDSTECPADGSVRVAEGPVLSRVADAAAAHLEGLGQSLDRHSALVGESGRLAELDRALKHRDLPAVGSVQQTPAAALIQLAPLALRLHWGPFHPGAWLEFFLHPISPVSSRLARRLARTLDRVPARKSAEWTSAIEGALGTCGSDEERRRMEGRIVEWLEPEEFIGTGDTGVLGKTARKLAGWAGKRGASSPEPERAREWYRASGLIRQLAVSIESVPEISRDDLERVIGEWLNLAEVSERSPGEVGRPRLLRKPGHLLEPVDHVVWWIPQEPAPRQLPWYPVEIDFLSAAGCVPPDPALERDRLREEGLRPILLARESFALFRGPGEEKLERSSSPVTIRILAECGDGVLADPDILIPTEEVPVRPLARPRECWQLGRPEFLEGGGTESFSSLQQFIYSPWQWVFRYRARLNPGDVCDLRIVDDARTRGSFLHGFVESLLEPEPDPLDVKGKNLPGPGREAENPAPAAGLLETLVKRLFDRETDLDWRKVSPDAVEAWVEANWTSALERRAAHYLVPGHEASRSELLYLAKKGLQELIRQLRAADIVAVTCEERIPDVPFVGGHLKGFIDLEVENAGGELGVIDLKLGGKTYRRDELEKGRHLQLATYGYLVRETEGKTPSCAYFIFSGGGTLLARSNRFFPAAQVVSPRDTGEEWLDCWREFEEIWRRRRSELDEGRIEVTHSRFRQDFSPAHWAIATPEAYSPFLHLLGWEVTD